MGKTCDHSSFFILMGSSLFLLVTRQTTKSQMGLKFGMIRLGTKELAAPELLKKSPYMYNGRHVVTTLEPSFLDASSLFLQVTNTTIKACMNLNFVKIPLPTSELAALGHLKN